MPSPQSPVRNRYRPRPGAVIIGVDGHLVEAEAVIRGRTARPLQHHRAARHSVRETRDRVYAAVRNSGQAWPARKMTVTLLPASLPRHGTGFDLAIAIAVLTAAGAVAAALDGCVFTAELGLDGSLRPVRGVLPALLAAARRMHPRGRRHRQRRRGGDGGRPGRGAVPDPAHGPGLAPRRRRSRPGICLGAYPGGPGRPARASLACLAVPPCVRQAIEATAAGGHHLCLTGPHGARSRPWPPASPR